MGRTMLVVISIAVGVLAIGLTMSSNRLMNELMDGSREASNPAHARMVLGVPFDQTVVDTIAALPEIDAAEGWVSAGIRWKPAPDAEWQEATLIAHPDYDAQVYDLIQFVSGSWPIGDEAIAVEFNHLQHYGVPLLNGTVYVEGVNQTVEMTLVGTVRDPSQSPPPFNLFGTPTFYVDLDGFEAITGSRLYTSLRFGIPVYTEEKAEAAAVIVQDRLERLGVKSAVQAINIDVTDPDRSQAQEFLDGLGIILVTMAIMSLGLSVFLVINTINAIIASQIRQIGIMKIIGGIRRQIITLYLSSVLVYGGLSVLIAIPLGALGGFFLTKWLLGGLNVQVTQFQLLPEAIATQIAVGLLTPLAAALVPILRGTSISTREAIGSFGLGRGIYGTRKIDRALTGLRGIPRMTALTLRNTFRRMGRVVMTELTLVGAGAIFMMVVTTGTSFNKTIDDIWARWGFEVFMVFQGFERVDRIAEPLESDPGVESVEIWIWMDANAHVPGKDGPADLFTVSMRGLPEGSVQFNPQMTAGRGLRPEDGHALIINQKLAREMGVEIGDQIVIDLPGGRDSTWTIVGEAFDLAPGGVQNTVYMYRESLSADLHQPGQGTVAQIRTTVDTREIQDRIFDQYSDYFESQGSQVAFGMGQIENQELTSALWGLIGGLLSMMSVLMAVVGSIGLSGTLSINVIERRREIGVMRAVGASSVDVSRIFIGEGLLLGVVSWVFAVPLSMLAAQQFVNVLGDALQFPFFYRYSVPGMWMWLGIVIGLALVASWLPAQRAASISVRESLAYE